MVNVICDTNFLIHLATKKIKNLDHIEEDIGTISFLVPNVVYNELLNLKNNIKKKIHIEQTLEYIQKFEKICINGNFADKEILDYIKNDRCFVGTMDFEFKKNIKKLGSYVISFHNDKMVLES